MVDPDGQLHRPVTRIVGRHGEPVSTEEWGAMFRSDGVGAHYHSINWHLVLGVGGFPRGSKWGPDEPVHLFAAEETAYSRSWQGMSQEDSNTYGDYAMQCGAKGYLDGGTVPVGDGPCAWAPKA